MKALKSLWKDTKERFDRVEKSLVDCYIAFLREVAKVFLEQNRRVFFRENLKTSDIKYEAEKPNGTYARKRDGI